MLAGIANVLLIEEAHGVIVVDSGWRGFAPLILRQVARYGYRPKDVRLIVLTHVHVDHAGSAAELRRRTGAPIAAHRGDYHIATAGAHRMPQGRGWAGVSSRWLVERSGIQLHFEPFTPDIALDAGQTLGDFGLEGYVLHTPGHTAGSVTLALENGVTIVGDALINQFRVGYPMYWEDPDQGRESGKKIQALRPRVLFSGHGRPFSGQELDRYLERYDERRKR
jgi:glyoxylase-like metal-dependent hydrolase (beta-lactamase superfamily II)